MQNQKPREIAPEVANIGRGRERVIVGREQRTDAETRSGVDAGASRAVDGEVEQRESSPPRVAEENGYAGRVDREEPRRGLGATQSGERQTHDLPGVGNRPAK